MKIGLDVAQTCTPRAGCAWYADSLTRALVDLGPAHHFFLYHQFGTLINSDTSAGTFIDAPNVTATFTDVTPEEASRIWTSPNELLIKTGAPELVHAMSFRAPRVPGAKLVFTVYDLSFWAVPEFTTEQNRLTCQYGVLEALSHADGLIFISESSRAEFERFLPGWLEKRHCPAVVTPLAPRACDPAVRRSASHERFWLAVGSIEPRKNYETLLDAFELYWQQSTVKTRLRIVGGRGWNSEHTHRRISSLVARGLAQYAGYLEDADLVALYADAEALIFPSWYEGFGLPIIEAMTRGCPVICSRNTSIPEVGGDAVIYVDPSQASDIVAGMLRLECDIHVRNRHRDLGRDRAQHFSWKRTAERTLEFYAEVLHSNS